MIRYWFFWVSTVVFLAFSLGIIWKVFPPLLGQVGSQRNTLAKVDANIQEEQQYLATVKSLQDNKEKVEQLNTTASQALPVSLEPDMLLLQLDGLLKSLSLEAATVTVPLGQTAAPVVSSSSSSSSDTAKPGSVGASGSSAPVVKSDIANQTTFNIGGEMSYVKAIQLLTSLQTFSRWNKVTTLDINQSANKTTVTLTAQVFSAPATTADFSGTDPNFLTKADKIFAPLKQYVTTPDYQTEGNYGRTDPFATP